jgi:hypothetical protein
MAPCPGWESAFADRLADDEDDARRVVLDLHLRTCAACRDELRDLEQVAGLVRRAGDASRRTCPSGTIVLHRGVRLGPTPE